MHLFDDLFVNRYDEWMLDGVNRGRAERALPGWVRVAMEVRRRSDEYDVVVSWSELVTLAMMTFDHFDPLDKPHVALMYWFSRPTVHWPMRSFGDSLHAIVTWSSAQRAYAIDELGIPPEKLYLVKHFVDQLFWRTPERDAQTICSAGSEMRDYPTLIEALRGTDIPCHIASDHVRVDRFRFGRRVSAEKFARRAPANVTIGRLSPVALRELYAKSRFVVVPLQASDTDNGINVLLEAMAMGKPVICSRTRGQVDAIQEGVTGLFVPVGDAGALRDAILTLWRDPARCIEMGRAARRYVEKHHTLDRFCREVKRAIDASIDGRFAASDGSIPEPVSASP
jgi:glycosyltransferase involved in cell wall biosynthesis